MSPVNPSPTVSNSETPGERVFGNALIMSNVFGHLQKPLLIKCLTLRKDQFCTAAKHLYASVRSDVAVKSVEAYCSAERLSVYFQAVSTISMTTPSYPVNIPFTSLRQQFPMLKRINFETPRVQTTKTRSSGYILINAQSDTAHLSLDLTHETAMQLETALTLAEFGLAGEAPKFKLVDLRVNPQAFPIPTLNGGDRPSAQILEAMLRSVCSLAIVADWDDDNDWVDLIGYMPNLQEVELPIDDLATVKALRALGQRARSFTKITLLELEPDGTPALPPCLAELNRAGEAEYGLTTAEVDIRFHHRDIGMGLLVDYAHRTGPLRPPRRLAACPSVTSIYEGCDLQCYKHIPVVRLHVQLWNESLPNPYYTAQGLMAYFSADSTILLCAEECCDYIDLEICQAWAQQVLDIRDSLRRLSGGMTFLPGWKRVVK